MFFNLNDTHRAQ